ncbi:hypothetical protein JCM6882_004994 [Rhodosporidiobolus microsporus]
MFSNILAKVREVWRRGFGRRKTRGVRQSEQSHSADPPVEPSPPRLPLELLFLVGDLVLSDAKNEDETEAAARQLCAVDRGFHERYGRRRQPRTVAVKGRAEVLSLTKRARADPAFARAVENLVVLDLVWIAGFALNPSLPPILCQILLASLNSLKALQIYAPGDDDQTVPSVLLPFPRNADIASTPFSTMTSSGLV